MNSKLGIRLAVGVLGSVLAVCPASAGSIEGALTLLNAKDSDGAYRLLKPEEGKRAGDPAYDYLLGLAAIDSGRPVEAVNAFERLLAVNPHHHQARAELGRAYIALKEYEAARRELTLVRQQQSIPADVQAVLDRYVRALDTGLAGDGTVVGGLVRITGGYDTNVNNSTSDQRILIPAFAGLGMATLSSGARQQEDGFGEVFGRASLSHGISLDRRLIGDVSASYRKNGKLDAFDQGVMGVNLGVAQATPDWGTFTLSGQFQSHSIDDDVFRRSYGALGQWSTRLEDATDLAAYLQYAHLSHPNDKPRNADRLALGGTAGRMFGGDWKTYGFAGLYLGVENVTDSAFDHFSHGFIGLRAGGEIAVPGDVTAYANLAIEKRRHQDADPLFLTERDDLRTDVVAGLRRPLLPGVAVGLEVAYTNAGSNIALYDYDRVVTALSLSVDF